MKTSDQINELATALAKAQLEIATAKLDSENSHFKSVYASLASVTEACRTPLAKNGLSWTQTTESIGDGRMTMTTRLLHSSGQFIEATEELYPKDSTPHAIASAKTYARRYQLASITGVAPEAEEDDDGNHASGRPVEPRSISRPAQSKPQGQSASPGPAQGTLINAGPSLVDARRTHIARLCKNGWTPPMVVAYIQTAYKTKEISQLTEPQFQDLTAIMSTLSPKQAMDQTRVLTEPVVDVPTDFASTPSHIHSPLVGPRG
jgi:hypothetical protein